FVVSLFCLLLLSCSETTKIDTTAGVCEILKQHPNCKKSLKQSQAKYNLEPAFIMALIYQESRFDANAKNKYSSAYGYAQEIDRTWKHFQQKVKATAKRNNFTDSIEFIGRHMTQLSKSLTIKKSHYQT
ncbi:transglycosylase SLT domain-containing protein, partial [Francisella tularensis]|uniref:transglycosylase SLT domain-containing protein n=1 Tax=Francisella tularensis TaxID=263 RepID=UPI00174B23E2